MSNLSDPFDKILEGARNATEVTPENGKGKLAHRRNILRHSNFNVARALAYMMLRERDLRRLRAIACGRSMRMGGVTDPLRAGDCRGRAEVG